MNLYYTLNGHEPVVTQDVAAWGRWFESTDRRVAEERYGGLFISTVFLGLNASLSDVGAPMLFETMVFKGIEPVYEERCATWDQAVAMHDRAVARVKGGVPHE